MINNTMIYFKPIAHNTRTKQRVQQQDLGGHEFTREDQAWEAAQGLVEKMQRTSRDQWVAMVESYSK